MCAGKRYYIVLILLLLHLLNVTGLDNGLALTPPMGWLDWERFACNTDCTNDPYNCISEKLFMDMADSMVSMGFRDAGYEYVNIDDCWASKERDSSGKLQADPDRFPSGIKALADYMHTRGLKLGIYGDIGTHTCGGYPGTEGYIQKDADTFAEWGVDSLKLDGCYASPELYETGYPNMSKALNQTGRPILFSCSWPAYIKNPNYTLLADICNLWRNYNDISDSWDSVVGIINHYADNQNDFQPFAGPGHWNDPDMIIVGDFGLSLDQQQAQMALWAIFAAPLLMSNDLRKLSPESQEVLLNKDVIAVNQDPMGVQGRLIRSFGADESDPTMTGKYHIFSKPMAGNSVAVALLNTNSFGYPRNISFTLAEVGLSTPQATVMDLFSHKSMGVFYQQVWAMVNNSGVRLLRLIPVKKGL